MVVVVLAEFKEEQVVLSPELMNWCDLGYIVRVKLIPTPGYSVSAKKPSVEVSVRKEISYYEPSEEKRGEVPKTSSPFSISTKAYRDSLNRGFTVKIDIDYARIIKITAKRQVQ